ncbi:rhodanese-like domain-containing protein [Cyanobium sp. NIES-981]|uniref:rhodanese-like domain-containing protein n=1 Tax=Cyanobium sp. NIES-981 TaxID=1851505 RepID=UPI000B363481|nr:rhodanese-like domain-containing protein [Cyanobium sp. NIES-981]
MPTPVSITAPALHQRLEAGEAIQLVDVRETAELELARLPHPVIHLPLSQSDLWLSRLEQTLERDRPVAVLCHAGIRSWQFACWLMEQHHYPHVWNLVGGIDAWSNQVDPTVPRY